MSKVAQKKSARPSSTGGAKIDDLWMVQAMTDMAEDALTALVAIKHLVKRNDATGIALRDAVEALEAIHGNGECVMKGHGWIKVNGHFERPTSVRRLAQSMGAND